MATALTHHTNLDPRSAEEFSRGQGVTKIVGLCWRSECRDQGRPARNCCQFLDPRVWWRVKLKSQRIVGVAILGSSCRRCSTSVSGVESGWSVENGERCVETECRVEFRLVK